jgi:hypothetical protein
MAKKTLKNTPKNLREMARQGEHPAFTPVGATGSGLKGALGLQNRPFAGNAVLSRVSGLLKKLHTLSAKRPFKGSVKGGLKVFLKNGPSHWSIFPKNDEKGRFYHGKLV